MANHHPRSALVVALAFTACEPAFPSLDAAQEAAVQEASVLDTSSDTMLDGNSIDSVDASDVQTFDADVVQTDVAPDVVANDQVVSEASPCVEGASLCDGVCVQLARDTAHCGACGMRCSLRSNSTASCREGVCFHECLTGFADCDGNPSNGCEALLDSNQHCGRCNLQCPSNTVCSGSMCRSTTDLPPPRQLAPLSGMLTLGRRPTLAWQLAPAAMGAQIVLCRERACTNVLQTIDVNGSSTRLELLTPGVYFWRARSRTSAGLSTQWSAVWQFRVPQRETPSSGAAGIDPDFNGDGFSDVLVGSPSFNTNVGVARLFHGSASGPAMRANWVQNAPAMSTSRFGVVVSAAGDVNGDGYVDAVIGATEVTFASGRAYVYLGSGEGLGTAPTWSLSFLESGARFGEHARFAGDLNRDGYADLVVSAPGSTGGRGLLRLYHGTAGAMPGPITTFIPFTMNNQRGGRGLGAAGDVNGDGLADLVIGGCGDARVTGAAMLFLGDTSATGLAAAPSRQYVGTALGDYYGFAARGIGDVNGDGFSDFAIGSFGAIGGRGRVEVFLGAAAGASATPYVRLDAPMGTAGGLGFTVAGGGDVNGDGFFDFVATTNSPGEVHLHYGNAEGINTTPVLLQEPGGSTTIPVGSASIVPDVDGDGFADVVVGVPDGNAAWIYRGGAMGVAMRPSWIVEGGAGEGIGATTAQW